MHEPFITPEAVRRAAYIPETEDRAHAWTVEDFFRGAPLPDEEKEGLAFFSGLMTGLAVSLLIVAAITVIVRLIWAA